MHTMTTEQKMNAILAARAIYAVAKRPTEYGTARSVASMVLGARHPQRDELRQAIELDLVTWRDSRAAVAS